MKSMFKQRGECHKRFINNIYIYIYIFIFIAIYLLDGNGKYLVVVTKLIWVG